MKVLNSFIIGATNEYEAFKASLPEVYGADNFDFVLSQVSVNPGCGNRFDIGGDSIVYAYAIGNGYYRIDYTARG